METYRVDSSATASTAAVGATGAASSSAAGGGWGSRTWTAPTGSASSYGGSSDNAADRRDLVRLGPGAAPAGQAAGGSSQQATWGSQGTGNHGYGVGRTGEQNAWAHSDRPYGYGYNTAPWYGNYGNGCNYNNGWGHGRPQWGSDHSEDNYDNYKLTVPDFNPEEGMRTYRKHVALFDKLSQSTGVKKAMLLLALMPSSAV